MTCAEAHVDGQWIAADDKSLIDVVNPAADTVIGRVPSLKARMDHIAHAVADTTCAHSGTPNVIDIVKVVNEVINQFETA